MNRYHALWISYLYRPACIFGLACLMKLITTCGGGGGGSGNAETCPGAQDLFDYSESLRNEAQTKLRFGSSWEITYKIDVNQPARLFQLNIVDDDFNGAFDYHGETTFTFTIPSAPEPFTCAEIQNAQNQFGNQGPQILREIIVGLYEVRVNEKLGSLITSPNKITSTGTGTHASIEDPSFETNRYVDYLACAFDNPCGQDRFETTGCNGSGIAHSVDAEIHIVWTAGNDPILTTYINDFTPQGTTQTQSTADSNYSFDATNYSFPCNGIIPICDGPVNGEISCGLGFQEFDFSGSPDVVFKRGPVQYYSHTYPWGELREREVELKCTSGCECNNVSDCDDGKVCTRDACNGGNCENIPDDSIRPEQVAEDCRTCENGEIRSARKIAKQECETIKTDAIKSCSQSPNWLVHWTAQYGSQTEDAHYCFAGVVPGDSEITICDGQGACSVGSPVTTRSGGIDRQCKNYDGQFVQFVCDVNCTQCLQ